MPYAGAAMAVVRSSMCGLAAGAIGTLCMDLVWFLRYKRGGGESAFIAWETASGLTSWNDASAPARVGKLLFESLEVGAYGAQPVALERLLDERPFVPFHVRDR